jgi:hypothetical protein
MKEKDRLLQFSILLILCGLVMLAFLVFLEIECSYMDIVLPIIALILLLGKIFIGKIRNVRSPRKTRS